ncbi:MAG TPA: GPW/gp25 family protein [Chloroflexota bacterium]|nr:GPW/gp25 family protein [Chloroflexota bacterium]
MDGQNAFLGAGWTDPMTIDGRGGVALVSGESAIERSIRTILGTAKGERRMRPQFGCGIHDLIFAPNDATTAGLVHSQVLEALGWWEPRIEVLDVEVGPEEDDPALLLIHIRYVTRATNSERNLVYPFYLIPGEE